MKASISYLFLGVSDSETRRNSGILANKSGPFLQQPFDVMPFDGK